jgi:hypothetical protein
VPDAAVCGPVAGLAAKPLTVLDLVKMIEAEEAKLGRRLTDYLSAADLK